MSHIQHRQSYVCAAVQVPQAKRCLQQLKICALCLLSQRCCLNSTFNILVLNTVKIIMLWLITSIKLALTNCMTEFVANINNFFQLENRTSLIISKNCVQEAYLLIRMQHRCNECITTFKKIVSQTTASRGTSVWLGIPVIFIAQVPLLGVTFALLTNQNRFLFIIFHSKKTNIYQKKMILFENAN